MIVCEHKVPISKPCFQCYQRFQVEGVRSIVREFTSPARETLIAYLKLKVEEADWHGVSDAANDLRVLEAHMENDK